MIDILKQIEPVLPSSDIARDVEWHEKHSGFTPVWFDKMYAILKRKQLSIHLQWHADTDDDPLLGRSVIRIFTDYVKPLFDEFVKRGTVDNGTLILSTERGTDEFGFYDLSNNAIFIVEAI